jgi:hypothetical protein
MGDQEKPLITRDSRVSDLGQHTDEELFLRSKQRRNNIKEQKLKIEKLQKEYGDNYIPPSEVKRKYSNDFWSSNKKQSWLVSLFYFIN